MRKEVLPYILDGIKDEDHQEVSGNKTIHSLAVKAYKKEHSNEEGEIDAKWVDVAIQQFKMFLFAGHDTVSSTVCFVAAILSFYPDKLANLRAELEEVLGPDPSAAQDRIAESPEILNRLTYLAAVIKETLRLYGPVSGTARGAQTSNYFLHHPVTGQDLPCWNFMIYGHQAALHRDPTYWPDPHNFIPERFTVKEGDPLYPHKNTWRPFELGSRNCIGQEFAMVEMRLVLALMLLEFDFETTFDPEGPKYFGSVLYQGTPKEEITMHPREGMPIRVSLRKKA
jgi:cytochrome P450